MNAQQKLAELLPHCTVTHGHHLAGVGRARWGWAAKTAAGQVVYLARNAVDAVEKALELGTGYGR